MRLSDQPPRLLLHPSVLQQPQLSGDLGEGAMRRVERPTYPRTLLIAITFLSSCGEVVHSLPAPIVPAAGWALLWAITSDQQSCFSCDVGVMTYQVDPNSGGLTPVPNSFFLLTNSEVGNVASLAITQ